MNGNCFNGHDLGTYGRRNAKGRIECRECSRLSSRRSYHAKQQRRCVRCSNVTSGADGERLIREDGARVFVCFDCFDAPVESIASEEAVAQRAFREKRRWVVAGFDPREFARAR